MFLAADVLSEEDHAVFQRYNVRHFLQEELFKITSSSVSRAHTSCENGLAGQYLDGLPPTFQFGEEE